MIVQSLPAMALNLSGDIPARGKTAGIPWQGDDPVGIRRAAAWIPDVF
jgi:hypothetical protein